MGEEKTVRYRLLLAFFKLAVINVTHRKLRSWLTMIGIFIGIAAVVSLVSLSEGLKVGITEQFAAIGTDKLFIQAKGAGFVAPGGDTIGKLSEDDVRTVEKVKGVQYVAAHRFQAATISFDKQQLVAFIADYPRDDTRIVVDEIYRFQISEGRFLRPHGQFEVVVGYDLGSLHVFEKNLRVGDKVIIDDIEFKVVGILKQTGDPGTDRTFFLPKQGYDALTPSVNVTMMLIKTNDDPSVVAENVEKELRRERGLKKGEEDFEIQTPDDLLATVTTILQVVQVVLIGIAAISLLVGGIGIMNTMYTAVLERKKEVGVMKAIGARNEHILFIFLLESGLLGIVGGILGILLGMGISSLVSFIAAQALGSNLVQPFFSPSLLIGALVFSFLVGGLSGTLPAMQAAKLPPIQAVRYE